MEKASTTEVLDKKAKVFNELGINSENELSKAIVFRKLITLDVDKEVLGMILPNIGNVQELIGQQYQFLTQMADKQKIVDEKAMDAFNKTKEIISEILKANPTMDKDVLIYLIDSLKEMDRYISNHAIESGNRMERLIKRGMAMSGVVGAVIVAIIFKGGGGSGKS